MNGVNPWGMSSKTILHLRFRSCRCWSSMMEIAEWELGQRWLPIRCFVPNNVSRCIVPYSALTSSAISASTLSWFDGHRGFHCRCFWSGNSGCSIWNKDSSSYKKDGPKWVKCLFGNDAIQMDFQESISSFWTQKKNQIKWRMRSGQRRQYLCSDDNDDERDGKRGRGFFLCHLCSTVCYHAKITRITFCKRLSLFDNFLLMFSRLSRSVFSFSITLNNGCDCAPSSSSSSSSHCEQI